MSQPPAERLPQDSGPSPPARPQRRQYSTEFRTRAVALAARPDLTIAAAAADIGVSPSTLRRWIRETVPADPRPVHERIEDEWPDWRSFDWPVLPSPEPRDGNVLSEPPGPEPSAPEPLRTHPAPGQPAAPAPAPARVDDIIFPATARLGSAQRLGMVAVAFVAAVVLSRLVPEDYRLRPLIVDLHVMSLVASFGAVLLVDWHGLLWLARRRTLPESTRLAAAASPIIWAGLGGLLVTGALLRPDLGSPLTLVKLALVLAVSVNGAVMAPVRLKLTELSADASPVDVPEREWRRMVLATTVSQIGWWGAVVIGFVNSST